jgi:MFS family permease
MKKELLPIFLVVAVDILGLTLVLPLLPFYAERFGATPQIVGLLVTTYALCQLVAGPFLGQLSDRYGRRRLLIVSQIGTLIGFIILGNATSLVLVFLSRFIDGITGGKRLAVLNWAEYVRFFKRPELGSLLTEFFCFSMAFAMFISGFALYAERRFTLHGLPFGPREVGYLYAYSGFLGIIIQGGLLGRLVKRFGEGKLVIAGFLAMALGHGLMSITFVIPALLVVSTFGSFGTGILRPTLTSLITQAVGRHEQGVVLGLNQSLMSIAQIVAPIISGFFIGQGDLALWAISASIMGVAGLILSTRHISSRKVLSVPS